MKRQRDEKFTSVYVGELLKQTKFFIHAKLVA